MFRVQMRVCVLCFVFRGDGVLCFVFICVRVQRRGCVICFVFRGEGV